ncbi:unnamed protein product [Staurois parvus]|uniref:Uncharacterized protein n=1 Tax=Staurois parvus TaxID=386267 RepID=A0ABN9GKZ0_9NEOB|nr:unnamed protein product [Staurois parvus]
MLLPVGQCVMGPLYGLPLLHVSSVQSAMCHFQVSSLHCCGFHFVIGCCMASIAAASTATLWLHTLVLAP